MITILGPGYNLPIMSMIMDYAILIGTVTVYHTEVFQILLKNGVCLAKLDVVDLTMVMGMVTILKQYIIQ